QHAAPSGQDVADRGTQRAGRSLRGGAACCAVVGNTGAGGCARAPWRLPTAAAAPAIAAAAAVATAAARAALAAAHAGAAAAAALVEDRQEGGGELLGQRVVGQRGRPAEGRGGALLVV